MKNSIKKITALALSSLGILASAPSSFCVPRTSPSDLNPAEKSYRTTAPMKSSSNLVISDSTPSAFRVLKLVPGLKNYRVITPPSKHNIKPPFSTEVITSENITKKSLNYIVGANCLEAPFATVVQEYALSNQPNLQRINLPNVSYLGYGAFANCEKLKEVVLNNEILRIDSGAFVGCNKDLKIIFKGRQYPVTEIMKKIKPTVKVNRNSDFAKSLIKDYGKDKVNLIYAEQI